MNTKSLRTFIAINLAALILVATILLDFVVLSTDQNRFAGLTATSHRIMAAVAADLLLQHKNGSTPLSVADSKLQRLFRASGATSMVITDPDGALLYAFGENADLHARLLDLTTRCLASRKQFLTGFAGKTWGVLLVRPRYLMVTGPVNHTQNMAATPYLGLAFDLGDFYSSQRKSQAVILGYAIINTIILVVMGVYLIGRVTVNPINRLVRMAETYRDEEHGLDIFYSRGKNEFQKLSSALNRMLKRISEDRRSLQASLEELEKANMEIRARQDELIRAEKLASVGRLSAGIAHEIGNPIGIVLGYLNMLKKPDLPMEKREDYSRRCEAEINRINAIIRELLDFSRPSCEQARAVSLRDIITETVRMLGVQPGVKEILFDYSFKADDDRVLAPPDRLRQVVLNLLINAIDAVSTLPPGHEKRIFVLTETDYENSDRKNRWIKVEISDNGPGIEQKNLNLIFDPFFTTKEPGKGTGLGLSVCFMIVEGLGGEIKAESSPGKGTTIILRLPAAEKDGVT